MLSRHITYKRVERTARVIWVIIFILPAFICEIFVSIATLLTKIDNCFEDLLYRYKVYYQKNWLRKYGTKDHIDKLIARYNCPREIGLRNVCFKNQLGYREPYMEDKYCCYKHQCKTCWWRAIKEG